MIVPQAARVLDLLEYFARAKKPASLADISSDMGWPRSTTFNLLTTLADRGYLYEPRPRKGHYPTQRWLTLLHTIIESEMIPEGLVNAVGEISMATKETVAVAAPAGTKAIMLYVMESPAPIRFSAEVGYQVPIHATSAGRALLAQYDPRERETVLKRVDYVRLSDESFVDAAQVEDEIHRAAERGWHENIEGDLNGVAMPVPVGDRRLSVVVAGPATRMRGRTPEIAAIMARALDRCIAK